MVSCGPQSASANVLSVCKFLRRRLTTRSTRGAATRVYSIWHYDGLVRIGQSEIDEAERKVRISNKTYRYQKVGGQEILNILGNPVGKILLSRPAWPSKLPQGPEIKELIGVFRTATPH